MSQKAQTKIYKTFEMRKILAAKPRTAIIVVFVAGFILGQLKPIDWAYWKIAESIIPTIKEKSLAETSPFLSIPKHKWLMETERAFVVESPDKEAPYHFLVIPKKRIIDITEADNETLTELFVLVNELVVKYKINDDGFRIVINTNPLGAQTVYHLHLHVLAGRQLRWPPG